MSLSLSARQIRALLLDVEGTTTPPAFVYEVLFPFARMHAAAYLASEGNSAHCRAIVERLREERAADVAQGLFSPDQPPREPSRAPREPVEILPYVRWLMDRDRKSPGLKALQGLIWELGYRSGELHGAVYDDVPAAFERWRQSGLGIYIYSSGSVLAQQLLFSSTSAGDLTASLKGYFDTAVGPKTSPDSYRLIADRIEIQASHILFVSDVVSELDAAQAGGLQTVLCVREDESSATGVRPAIHTFDEIVH